MRIKTGFNSRDVKFGTLKEGEAFVCKNKYDGSRTLYMKVTDISFEQFGHPYRYNAVNLEDGHILYVPDDDIVSTTNAHIAEE